MGLQLCLWPSRGLLKLGDPEGPWMVVLPPEANSKRHLSSVLPVCLFPFFSLPQSMRSLLRESNWSLQLQHKRPGRPPTHHLHPPTPLPGKSCCLTATPAIAFSVIAASATTNSPDTFLALPPPPQSNPSTYRCTDG